MPIGRSHAFSILYRSPLSDFLTFLRGKGSVRNRKSSGACGGLFFIGHLEYFECRNERIRSMTSNSEETVIILFAGKRY